MTSKKRELENRTEWRNDAGNLHREDGPAVEWRNGNKEWWVAGKLHRVDGPAIVWANGSKEWWLDGKLHRVEGPAVEWSDGGKDWFYSGKKFNNQEAWFEALALQDQITYLFNMEEPK